MDMKSILKSDLNYLENKTNKSITDIKKIRKIMIILELMRGKTIEECSKQWEIPKSTLYRWKKEIREDRISINTGGRNYNLSIEQMKEISEILQKTPNEYGYCMFFWTGKILKHLIRKRFEIDVDERTAQKILFDNDIYPREYTTSEFEDMLYKYEEADSIDLWYFLGFTVWKKDVPEVKEGRIYIGKSNILYYFIALNVNENKLLIYEVNDESKVKYNDLACFMKELAEYMKKDKNIIVMSKSSWNIRLAGDMCTSKKFEINRNKGTKIVFIPKLKDESEVLIEDLNPLYNLKGEILKIVNKYKKPGSNKLGKNIIEKIDELIEDLEYDLY